MRATAPGPPADHRLQLDLAQRSPEPGSPLPLASGESWGTPTSSPHPPAALEWRVPSSPWNEIRREEVEELLPPSVVVLCAREEEARHVRGWLEGALHESPLAGQWRRSSGQMKGVSSRVDLVVCGVGATNAAAAAAAACCAGSSHTSPVAVFNVGRAVGHQRDEYVAGDVVVGIRTVGLDVEPGSGLSPTPRAGSSDGLVSPRSGTGAESAGGGLEERHRSVRRVETDSGLLAAARVAVAAQRVGVVLEGVIGSTEAWAAPRLGDLVRANSEEDEIAVTDGEAHSAAVVCRRWSVPYLSMKEVLTATPTEQGRRAAGGRAAELLVRILRTYRPIILPGSGSFESPTGADPLTPPVSARVQPAVIKPKPLKFEEMPTRPDRFTTKAASAAPQPERASRAYEYMSMYGSAGKVSGAIGVQVGGEKAAAAATSSDAARSAGLPGPWHSSRNDAGSGSGSSWGSTAGSGVALAGVVVTALAFGCGIGFYLAASMTGAGTPTPVEMRAAMAGVVGPSVVA